MQSPLFPSAQKVIKPPKEPLAHQKKREKLGTRKHGIEQPHLRGKSHREGLRQNEAQPLQSQHVLEKLRPTENGMNLGLHRKPEPTWERERVTHF